MKTFIKQCFARVSILALPLLMPALARAELPPGNPITFSIIDNIAIIILRFLMSISIVAIVMGIIISGIIVAYSGDDKAKFAKGLAMLKSTIWGAFIILGSGVIINTVMAVIDRTFFCQVSFFGICFWS